MIISIFNLKGGCTKTATTINLGHALARLSKRVLLVDMDFQMNTTSTLYGQEVSQSKSLYQFLDPSIEKIDPKSCIVSTGYSNLHLLPSGKKLLSLEPHLILNAPKSWTLFRDRFREYAIKNYDYTLIDNHPALGVFTISSLTASDFAIIPNEAGSRYNIEGLGDAIDLFNDIKNQENSHLKKLKILISKVDRRIKNHLASIEQLNDFMDKEFLFKTIIPSNADIQNAEAKGVTVFAYRSNATSAKAYTKLAKELIKETENV